MTDPTPRTAATARERFHDALCDMPKPHGCHVYGALDDLAASTGRVAGPDWKSMYLNLLADWSRVSDHLGIEAETAGDIIVAIRALAAPASPAGVSGGAELDRLTGNGMTVAEPTAPAPSAGVSEFAALVDEARANHVRWEHEAEVLEECNRPLCIGAKVLLWPDIENPRSSAIPAPAPTPSEPVVVEALGRILDMSKGYPMMSGGSRFPSHLVGRIHNEARKALGEEPLLIADAPAPTAGEPVGRCGCKCQCRSASDPLSRLDICRGCWEGKHNTPATRDE